MSLVLVHVSEQKGPPPPPPSQRLRSPSELQNQAYACQDLRSAARSAENIPDHIMASQSEAIKCGAGANSGVSASACIAHSTVFETHET